MQLQISPLHKKRLTEIYEHLNGLRHDESSFTQMENLFYEAIAISRAYGNDENENSLLLELKDLERNEYGQTQKKFNKSRQREVAIKHFKVFFKRKLNSCL